MSTPEVSVILPVHDRATTIARALTSALAQQETTLEVVLVEDGPSDVVERTLAPFRSDPRLMVLRHPVRRGAPAARNTAIAQARGSWLAFLDSDDEWRPGKLAAQLAAARAAGPKVQMVLTGAMLDRGTAGMEVRIPATRPSCRDVIVRGCTQSPGSTALVARAAFRHYGPFDERLERLEDWDWLLRFTEGDEFLVVPEPLAVVHIRDFGGVEAVDRALSIVWRRHRPRVRAEGLGRLRAFTAAVLIERGFVRLVARRYASALPSLGAGLMLDALGDALAWEGPRGSLWRRARRRLSATSLRRDGSVGRLLAPTDQKRDQ